MSTGVAPKDTSWQWMCYCIDNRQRVMFQEILFEQKNWGCRHLTHECLGRYPVSSYHPTQVRLSRVT